MIVINREDTNELSSRLVSAFFKFSRVQWHNAPADGLTMTETSLLENIHRAVKRGNTPRVSDLSAALRVSAPTITQQLNNLEAKGLVQRLHSSEDKRAVHLSLTAAGEEALKTHRNGLERDFSEFVGLIGETEAERLITLLTQAQGFFNEKNQAAKSKENNAMFDRS